MASSGTARAKAKAKSAARAEAPRDYWTKRRPRLEVGDDRWRLIALRGKGRQHLDLTAVAESFDWTDASAILEGTLTLRMPPRYIDLSEGHTVVCLHSRTDTKLREIWRMRISSPNVTASSNGWALTLADDMKLLQLGKDDFIYHKDKRHPRGWTAVQIIADIAKRYGFHIGRMVKTRHRIKNFVKRDVSPLDAIVAVLLKEKTATRKKMKLAWRAGRMTVDPLKRSADMLELGPLLLEATYAKTIKEGFATALKASGTLTPKRGKKRKVVRTVVSKRAAQRYGYIHGKFSADDPDSISDVLTQAKLKLAELARPTKELSITVPGTPTLKRGSAIRVALPDINVKAIVFATEVRHSVSGGDYSMDVTCGFSDPFVDKVAKKKKQKKCDAATKRGRKPPAGCPTKPTRAKSKKARQRS